MVQQIEANLERYLSLPDTTPDLLRQLHEMKVTYKAIADHIGVTYMTVFRWAKGLSKPRPAKPVNDNLMFLIHRTQIDLGAMRLAKERAEADFQAARRGKYAG